MPQAANPFVGTWTLNIERSTFDANDPVQFTPDGRDYPVPGFPGLVVKTTLPSPGTIQTECRREDGSIVGQGTYAVSADGRSLTATTSGWDSQLRRFEV